MSIKANFLVGIKRKKINLMIKTKMIQKNNLIFISNNSNNKFMNNNYKQNNKSEYKISKIKSNRNKQIFNKVILNKIIFFLLKLMSLNKMKKVKINL